MNTYMISIRKDFSKTIELTINANSVKDAMAKAKSEAFKDERDTAFSCAPEDEPTGELYIDEVAEDF